MNFEMKKFCLRLGIVLAIVAAGAVGLEIWLRTMPNVYKYKLDYIKEHGDAVRVLAIGASYVENAISPQAIGDSVYNMALPAQPIDMDYHVLATIIADCPNLKAVIVCADHHSLYSNPMRQSVVNSYRGAYYQNYIGIPIYRPWEYYKCLEVLNRDVAVGKIDHYFTSFVKKSTAPYDCDSLGWRTNIESKNQKADWKTDRVEAGIAEQEKDYRETNLEGNIGYLVKMAELCKSNGVGLVVVTLPKSRYFREKYPESRIAKMRQATEEGAERCGYWYRDYYADERFGDEDFVSADHLSREGGLKFTSILVSDCPGLGK